VKRLKIKQQLTLNAYESFSDYYIQKTFSYDEFPIVKEMMDFFIGELQGRDVLDIGFGSGRDVIYMASQKLNVTGIEISLNFIKRLKKLNIASVYKMDMRQITFGNSSFNGIWCCASFIHVPKNEAQTILEKFNYTLKPKGLLFLSVKEGIGESFEIRPDSNINLRKRYFYYYSIDEISDLITKSKFIIKSLIINDSSKGFNWINVFAVKKD
jgi:2-polyprenyl-3-methyl-5-hydroxy-6-metoxy-1,4-benzoquinol methylase